MTDLWEFAKQFLTFLPVEVTENRMAKCAELNGSWDGLPVLKKLDFPSSRKQVEVLQSFFGLLEEESQMQEILKSSVEDYVDESYCSPRIELPTCLSYFN
jgi:hypothetical protein